jgi:RimJ/RimL family protein N-acetyltransferase
MSNIILTPLKNSDSVVLFHWINDRDLVQLNDNYSPTHEHNHECWLKSIINNPTVTIFAIRKRDNDELIGTCQLFDIDFLNRSAELQIRIGSRMEQGKGYGTDAIRDLLAYGFNDLGLNRIQLHVFQNNKRAIKTYEKIGFVKEGVVRQGICLNREYIDVVLMSLLSLEWQKT